MKKVGFTLAEVLITLAIIGVVAVLTLPALMSNTAEQQARTALKKMTNSLSQAASMNSAISGYDFSGVTKTNTAAGTADEAAGTLMAVLLERLNVDRSSGYTPPTGTPSALVDTAVYLKDGTAVYFKGAQTMTATQLTPLADGVMNGIPVIFDTNGKKAPNMISNCMGTTGTTGVSGWSSDEAATADCGDKSKRNIKDQYLMKLRGSSVGPLGACSSWMIDENNTKASEFAKYSGSTSQASNSSNAGG